MDTGFAEINGASIYYEVAGEGRPLVFVHAGIADRRMWDEQFDAFASHFRVIRYDRRGFGRTQMLAGAYSHHADLRGLLELLGVGRALLVGCSQGAKTITDFALAHPGPADALVLVAPALGGFAFAGEAVPQQSELEEAAAAGDLERVNELELQIWVDGPRSRPGRADPHVRERVREMNLIALSTPEGLGEERPLDPPAALRLGEIRTPTLVVVGDLDTPRTLAAADRLAEGIAGARKVVIKGTAHLPNMERPEEFNRLVMSFLGGLHNRI